MHEASLSHLALFVQHISCSPWYNMYYMYVCRQNTTLGCLRARFPSPWKKFQARFVSSLLLPSFVYSSFSIRGNLSNTIPSFFFFLFLQIQFFYLLLFVFSFVFFYIRRLGNVESTKFKYPSVFFIGWYEF